MQDAAIQSVLDLFDFSGLLQKPYRALFLDVVLCKVALLAKSARVVGLISVSTLTCLLGLSKLMIAAMAHVESVLFLVCVVAQLLGPLILAR